MTFTRSELPVFFGDDYDFNKIVKDAYGIDYELAADNEMGGDNSNYVMKDLTGKVGFMEGNDAYNDASQAVWDMDQAEIDKFIAGDDPGWINTNALGERLVLDGHLAPGTYIINCDC